MSERNSPRRGRSAGAASAEKKPPKKKNSEDPFGQIRNKSSNDDKQVGQKRLHGEVVESGKQKEGESRSCGKKRAKKEMFDYSQLNDG